MYSGLGKDDIPAGYWFLLDLGKEGACPDRPSGGRADFD